MTVTHVALVAIGAALTGGVVGYYAARTETLKAQFNVSHKLHTWGFELWQVSVEKL